MKQICWNWSRSHHQPAAAQRAQSRMAAGQCSCMLKIWPTMAMAAPAAMVPTPCRAVAIAGNFPAARDRAEMQDGEHGDDQGEAFDRRDLVPVRGDEQQYASTEENAAENDCDQYLPARSGWFFVGLLEGADSFGGGGIDETGRDPSG